MARLKTTTFDGGIYLNEDATITYTKQNKQTNVNPETNQAQNYIHIFDIIYPVGCIFQSTKETNPEELFGFGEWKPIQGKFLYAKDQIEETDLKDGGNRKINLLPNQVPNHKHIVSIPKKTIKFTVDASHKHDFPGSRSFAGIPSGARLSGECVGRISNGSWRMAQIDFKDGGYKKVTETNTAKVKVNSSINIELGGSTTDVLDAEGNTIFNNVNSSTEQKPIDIMPPYKAIYAWERVK